MLKPKPFAGPALSSPDVRAPVVHGWSRQCLFLKLFRPKAVLFLSQVKDTPEIKKYYSAGLLLGALFVFQN